jgi:hypothetical protein
VGYLLIYRVAEKGYLLGNWLRSSVFGEVCLFSIVFGALRPIVHAGESVEVRTLEAKKK